MHRSIKAPKLFNGQEWQYNREIFIEDGAVTSIEPIAGEMFVKEDADYFITPAFIDFQVYGAAGKLLAAFPQASTLQVMEDALAKEGTTLFQPTIATNSYTVVKQAIDAVKEYRRLGGKAVHGLHLEGPWINSEKRGAHLPEFIHQPIIEEVQDLLAYGKDVITTITLAPEVCSIEVIALLHQHNIILSAGHSNITYKDAMQAFDNGITAITHLYNAMSSFLHREPGLVGAAFQHTEVLASIIPDGHHVSFEAIKIAKKLMGDRLFAITDAVTSTDVGAYKHQLNVDKYECNGSLSGSALGMLQAFQKLVSSADIAIEEALRMCSLYPARALSIEHLYGKIAPGFAAQFVVLDKQLDLVEIITG